LLRARQRALKYLACKICRSKWRQTTLSLNYPYIQYNLSKICFIRALNNWHLFDISNNLRGAHPKLRIFFSAHQRDLKNESKKSFNDTQTQKIDLTDNSSFLSTHNFLSPLFKTCDDDDMQIAIGVLRWPVNFPILKSYVAKFPSRFFVVSRRQTAVLDTRECYSYMVFRWNIKAISHLVLLCNECGWN